MGVLIMLGFLFVLGESSGRRGYMANRNQMGRTHRSSARGKRSMPTTSTRPQVHSRDSLLGRTARPQPKTCTSRMLKQGMTIKHTVSNAEYTVMGDSTMFEDDLLPMQNAGEPVPKESAA